MTRWWTEAFAALTDAISVPILAYLSFLITFLTALGWYFWPSWLPWRWKLRRGGSGGSRNRSRAERRRRGFRLGRLRWRLRWRRRAKRPTEEAVVNELDPDILPDVSAAVLVLTADQLAAAGRYGEAVRERLRAIVRDLIERELIPPSPGWTVTELARGATLALPTLTMPLTEAVEIFSRIWYGLIPAAAADDTAMRAYAADITSNLAAAAAPVRSGS